MNKFLLRLAILITVLCVLICLLLKACRVPLYMPGDSYAGELSSLDESGVELSEALTEHIAVLSDIIGERNIVNNYSGLIDAAEYIERTGIDYGYQVDSHVFGAGGKRVRNLEMTLHGDPGEGTIVIGAHYDSAHGTPAANGNGSGIAVMLELAQLLKKWRPSKTIRFVAFVNGELPYFGTTEQGSARYAELCSAREENVIAMFSLETTGYFSDESGSQEYPYPINLFYPDRGNFIAFIGNVDSWALILGSVESFRENVDFPSEGASLPEWIPGIGRSDHLAFWAQGYPALMVTDAALFRYPHYHRSTDTIDKINFDKLARITRGLAGVIIDLSESSCALW